MAPRSEAKRIQTETAAQTNFGGVDYFEKAVKVEPGCQIIKKTFNISSTFR